MDLIGAHHDKRAHAVCIPYPVQSHITVMLKLAKLLHHRGFFVTFVNTEFNHTRLLKTMGPNSLDGLPDFRYETIPDGLPPSDADATQDILSLCESIPRSCFVPFCGLISSLNMNAGPDPDVPPVTCIVCDGAMTFALEAAQMFGLPKVMFWAVSACGTLGYTQFRHLVERGYTPLPDVSYLTNGYLETTIDWIPGMNKDIGLRDLPSFIRTTNSDDFMLNFVINIAKAINPTASALILNTFEALEKDALNALSAMCPHVYSIGPLPLMLDQVQDERLRSMGSNMWKEAPECIEWLNSKEPNSVLYVNFGSITVITAHQLTEFAWGLANSMKPFLWIIRPDIVVGGDTSMLPPEFVSETKDRGMLASWCPQEEVLKHPSVGGFLTHSGWNSTLESICGGVPVICWPFFAEQQTNCRYSCVEWEMGMEIDNDVKRGEVEILVRELMGGEKGQKMRKKAMDWKEKAEAAAAPGGSSYMNFNKLFKEVLLPH